MPSSLQRMATSWAANIAAYGEDSSRSALTFMPPVTRVMVSRPLESPRLAYVHSTRYIMRNCASALSSSSDVYIRKIGNVDEGIVEGSEDTGNAKDELACETVSCGILGARNPAFLNIPSRTCGPREMFSWAGRVTFFGGILAVDLVLRG